MRLLNVLLLTLITCSSQTTLAWSQTGHRAAAEVGDHFLSAEARIAVESILGREDLARASTWPDFMRADPGDFWQHEAGPWHYVTVPPGTTYEAVGAPPQGDAHSALLAFSETVLDAEASTEEKALALRFIIHIIGDLHQPLHVGNGEDRGGNDFAVSHFGEPSNLHRVWDDQMIDRWNLSYSELAHWLLDDITPERFNEWNTPDPMVWIAESAELRPRIYPEERDLFWRYDFEWKSTVEQRLAQAGVRTAAYLNQLFSKTR
jgi:hypothetical protein